MNRRLTLRTEHLAELSTSDLESVAGATAIAITNTGICYSLDATTCRTGVIMSIDISCQ